jgi:hypothetical protein
VTVAHGGGTREVKVDVSCTVVTDVVVEEATVVVRVTVVVVARQLQAEESEAPPVAWRHEGTPFLPASTARLAF